MSDAIQQVFSVRRTHQRDHFCPEIGRWVRRTRVGPVIWLQHGADPRATHWRLRVGVDWIIFASATHAEHTPPRACCCGQSV